MGQAFVNRGGGADESPVGCGFRVGAPIGGGRLFERPFVTAHPCRCRTVHLASNSSIRVPRLFKCHPPPSHLQETSEGPGDFLRHVGRSGSVMNYSTAKVHVADITGALRNEVCCGVVRERAGSPSAPG